MRIVLDGYNLLDSLTLDTKKLLATIIKVCDQIVINDLVMREYRRNNEFRRKASSHFLPELARLEELTPKAKVVKPRLGPQVAINHPSTHSDLVESAVRSNADILIAETQRRGKWERLAQHLDKNLRLRVLTAEQYVAEKGNTD